LDNPDGYRQQFNDRGHPEFRDSRAAARDLRRAKNDVLLTVGVVYKESKPDDFIGQERDLLQATREENKAGFVLSAIDHTLLFCSLWRFFSLRTKVLVSGHFQPFKLFHLRLTLVQALGLGSTSLLQIVKSEWRELGPIKFLFGGLPFLLPVPAVLSGWDRFWTVARVKRALDNFATRRIL
jgi:hypothetical protein